MRVLVGSIERPFDDVYALDETTRAAILDKDFNAQNRPFGADRTTAAVTVSLIPVSAGQCVAAFWPDVVGIPVQERYLNYEWDGKKVLRYFDYQGGEWEALSADYPARVGHGLRSYLRSVIAKARSPEREYGNGPGRADQGRLAATLPGLRLSPDIISHN